MKKYFKLFLNHILLFIISMVVCFWLGYFSTEYLYNRNKTTYSIDITTEVINASDVTYDFFYNSLMKYVKDSNNEYVYNEDGTHKIEFSYSSVDFKTFFEKNDITVSNTSTGINVTIKAKYFISSSGAILSSDSETRFYNVCNLVFHKKNDTNSELGKVIINNYCPNSYIVSLYTLLGGIVLYFGIFSIVFFVKKDDSRSIYNGTSIFRYPFTKAYWKSAIESLTKMRVFDICLIGILFSLQICCKLIHIPSGFATLGLGITYLVFAFICLLYGPIWGLIIGFLSDVIGAFMAPSGFGFHFCYTIQAMLTGFTYGMFLYKTDVTFSRCLGARIVVNLILNALIGSFLFSHLTINIFLEPAKWLNTAFIYIVGVSLPKNIIYLVPQSLLMFIFIRLVLPIVKGRGLVDDEVIDIQRYRKNKKEESLE